MPTLLVIDDEPNVLYSLEKSLRSEALDVLTAATGKQGIELAQTHRPDAVLLDVRLTDMSGLDAFDRIRTLDARLPVIIMTAYTTTETAIEATKRGALEYLLKPVDFRQLRAAVNRAIELRRAPESAGATCAPAAQVAEEPDQMVGDSGVMQEVYKTIGRLAPQDVTVLVLGESGTGKELVARAIHQHSRRADKPFLAINCAAIPESLLESELFGHEKGAFTGADRQRIGKFEQAHRGTMFLDEIGDMTAAAQARMLRLLQQRQFQRVGGNETLQADVRVIAATNQDLDRAVVSGRFRQDLLYRLNGFTIRLPPLRERRADVPALVEHFIRLSNRELNRQVRLAAPEALRLLQAYDWPGNVRELQSTIRYAVVHAPSDTITPGCLPEQFRAESALVRGSLSAGEAELPDLARFVDGLIRSGATDIHRRVALEVDRVLLEAILGHTRGNQVQASELLGISRTTLRARLRALGLAVEKQLLAGSGQGG